MQNLSMTKQFAFGNSEISYTLLRDSGSSAVKIVVELEHGVEVIAPLDVSEESIEHILHKKGRWITQKLIEAMPHQREYVSGEKYPYLGRQYTLVVSERSERRPKLIMRNNTFAVTVQPEMRLWDRHQASV